MYNLLNMKLQISINTQQFCITACLIQSINLSDIYNVSVPMVKLYSQSEEINVIDLSQAENRPMPVQ